MAETVFPKPLDQDVGEINTQLSGLAYLKDIVKIARFTYSIQIPIRRGTWYCGLLIYNTNGGGDGVYFVYLMGTSTAGTVRVASNPGDGTLISGTVSNGVLTLQAKNSGGTSLQFDLATWIGLG